MRLSRLVKLTIAASMVTAAFPAAATATPDTTPGPPADHPVLLDEVGAERALEAVQAAFDRRQDRLQPPAGVSDRGGELTQELLQLRLGLDELSAQDQATARAYLARPTGGGDFSYGADYGKDARPTSDCAERPTAGSNVCVHWARKTADAPPLDDTDGDRLPDQVEKTRNLMNLIWDRVVERGGYRAPLADAGRGGDDKLDIYLVDIGGDGLYGYCSSENVGRGRAAAAYCVLDDDYAKKQFPNNTPLGNLKVTAAHEFFHAVQFAYDVREDAWLMESTSTWLEDEIFDGVNDNRYYLARSAMRFPHRPLDTVGGSFFYGNWIWWRYLTERFPDDEGTDLPTLVRDVWERANATVSPAGTYSMRALSRTLAARGHELGRVFAEFHGQNRRPGTYEEGHAYRKAPLAARHRLDARERSRIATQTPSLRHMSSKTVAFVPKRGYARAGWKLRVNVNLPNPSRGPLAQLTTFRTDGTVESNFLALDRRGTGRLRVPFSSRKVKRVELTLTNGNHSYDCSNGTQWSCSGTPDKKRTYAYSARSVR